MLDVRDLCMAYLEGYMRANVAEFMISGKMLSSDLDALKKLAVKSMKDYIERSGFSYGVKESMKKNYEHWTDMTLHGIKQRLRDCQKLYE